VLYDPYVGIKAFQMFTCRFRFQPPDIAAKMEDLAVQIGNIHRVGVDNAERTDTCSRQVVECGLKYGYSFIIIADHGNAEYMINEDGSVNTAHTTNLVPCILIDPDYTAIRDGKLGDIAPTILKIMNVPVPERMSGDVLV